MGSGVTVNNTATVNQQDVIDSLTEQLAKANERMAYLERVAINASYSAFMEAACEKIQGSELMDNKTVAQVACFNRSLDHMARVTAERCVNYQLRKEKEND